MLVKEKEFQTFLDNCKNQNPEGIDKIIVVNKPLDSKDHKFFADIFGAENITLNSYRTVEPLRMLFYMPRVQVFPYEKKPMKRIIIGVKGCDLHALELLDKALINDDFIDPDYKYWRDNTYIISSDCQEIGATCHCTVFDGQPWADKNYDINISKVDDQFILDVNGEKGEELLAILKNHLTMETAPANLKEKQTTNREKFKKQVEKQNSQYSFEDYQSLRTYSLENWQKESKDCIGCGACTNSCCSCYCIIVNDETEGDVFTKVRSTDSCQLHGYAVVAGGDSPRPKMHERFRNRYLCKFDYMKSQFGMLGCDGCGRCIDACPGKIDMRDVVKNIKNAS